MAGIAHSGHHCSGKGLRVGRALLIGVVALVKSLFGLGLVVKDLYDLLPLDHLLNIAVDIPQILLLRPEVPAAALAYGHNNQEHQPQGKQRHQKQYWAEVQHHANNARKGQRVGKQTHQTVIQNLVDGLDIVGIAAHQFAVGVGVKVAEGQALHPGEEVLPDGMGGLLGDVDHNPGIGEAEQSRADIHPRHESQHLRQTLEIAWNNAVVNQELEQIRAADGTHRVQRQADGHHYQQPFRPAYIRHQLPDGLSHIFGRLEAAGSASSMWSRHQYSPPPAEINRCRGRFRCWTSAPSVSPSPQFVRRPGRQSGPHP